MTGREKPGELSPGQELKRIYDGCVLDYPGMYDHPARHFAQEKVPELLKRVSPSVGSYWERKFRPYLKDLKIICLEGEEALLAAQEHIDKCGVVDSNGKPVSLAREWRNALFGPS